MGGIQRAESADTLTAGSVKDPLKTLVCLFVIGAFVTGSSSAVAQDLRELARAQAIRNPGAPIQVPSPPGHYEPKTLEQLTNEAVVVVQATLSRFDSYLGSAGDRVLTDYLITAPTVISGRLSDSIQRVPGPGAAPILTVYGGEIVLEGVTVRCTDVNRGAIKDGGQYLLFLMLSRRPGPGRYEIYHGGIFEISGDQVTGLLRNAEGVFADFLRNRPKPKDLVARIRKAALAR